MAEGGQIAAMASVPTQTQVTTVNNVMKKPRRPAKKQPCRFFATKKGQSVV